MTVATLADLYSRAANAVLDRCLREGLTLDADPRLAHAELVQALARNPLGPRWPDVSAQRAVVAIEQRRGWLTREETPRFRAIVRRELERLLTPTD